MVVQITGYTRNNVKYVDVRKYHRTKEGGDEFKPTRKGMRIVLSNVPDMIKTLHQILEDHKVLEEIDYDADAIKELHNEFQRDS